MGILILKRPLITYIHKIGHSNFKRPLITYIHKQDLERHSILKRIFETYYLKNLTTHKTLLPLNLTFSNLHHFITDIYMYIYHIYMIYIYDIYIYMIYIYIYIYVCVCVCVCVATLHQLPAYPAPGTVTGLACDEVLTMPSCP